MTYPVVVPVSTGGGSIKPFESILEMISCGSVFLFFTIVVIGFAVYISIEIDSVLAKILCGLLLHSYL